MARLYAFLGELSSNGRHAKRNEGLCPSETGPGRHETAGGEVRQIPALCQVPFDEVRGVKLKTVELIVDERPLTKPRFKDDDLVPVRVKYGEKELQERLKALRARWDGELKLWYVRYGLIRGTDLEERLAQLYG